MKKKLKRIPKWVFVLLAGMILGAVLCFVGIDFDFFSNRLADSDFIDFGNDYLRLVQ